MKLPLPEIRAYPQGALGADLMAALALIFLAVPQALAYATIAGLPPVMGLYAAAFPVVVASLVRSSRHVVTGPTNAVSLLVGGAAVAGAAGTAGADPIVVAVSLALMVGLLQLGAGFLRLGAAVDFISAPVILGYITGAGLLIGIGQLHNLTGTVGPSGKIWTVVGGWVATLSQTQSVAVFMAAGTIVTVVAARVISRKIERRLPGAIIALSLGMAANFIFDLESMGLKVVSDIQPVPRGLPPLSMPSWSTAVSLMPLAVACTVLSLTESTAIGRSIASRTGQRLDASTEFVAEGLANLTAAFTGGYPVCGSLSRSALNEQAGAQTRLAGILSGLAMVGVLLAVGPLLGHTPIASLAGLLLVVAVDLVDPQRIRKVVTSRRSDAVAFVATLLGTWVFDLDKAIYLGVGISLIAYLRKARRLVIDELVPDEHGALHQVPRLAALADRGALSEGLAPCTKIRILHIEGSLFFGAAGELQSALDEIVLDADAKAVILRLRRARDLDATTADVIGSFAVLLRAKGRHLLVAGISEDDGRILESNGMMDVIGKDDVFFAQQHFFGSLNQARARAVELVAAECPECPHRHAPHDAVALAQQGRVAIRN